MSFFAQFFALLDLIESVFSGVIDVEFATFGIIRPFENVKKSKIYIIFDIIETIISYLSRKICSIFREVFSSSKFFLFLKRLFGSSAAQYWINNVGETVWKNT